MWIIYRVYPRSYGTDSECLKGFHGNGDKWKGWGWIWGYEATASVFRGKSLPKLFFGDSCWCGAGSFCSSCNRTAWKRRNVLCLYLSYVIVTCWWPQMVGRRAASGGGTSIQIYLPFSIHVLCVGRSLQRLEKRGKCGCHRNVGEERCRAFCDRL